MEDVCAIGIDLGGTKIEIAVIQPPDQIIDHIKIKTEVDKGPEGIVEDLCQAILGLLQRCGKKVATCGVAVAGQVDARGESVLFAPNLKWQQVPLKALIEQRCHLEVSLINDVRAALIGEWFFGAGQGCADCVCIFVGTGVGGGIVSGGRILHGHNNAAGELGVIVHQDKTFRCGRFYGAAGMELHLAPLGFVNVKQQIYGRPYYGMHFHVQTERKNHINQTYVLGYEWGKLCGLQRILRAFLEYHDGYSVEGQFCRLPTNYCALRFSYGF